MNILIPVQWIMCGVVKVNAQGSNLEEKIKNGIQYVTDNIDNIDFPCEKTYVDDSLEINLNMDLIKSLNSFSYKQNSKKIS